MHKVGPVRQEPVPESAEGGDYMADLLMVTPTYDEAANITALVERIATVREENPFDLLVVDDNSPDGTADVVRGLQRDRPWLHLAVRPGRAGLGSAYRHGFRWGLARGYAFLGEIDADLSHDPAAVPGLWRAAVAGADLALGSRYVPGGRTVGWPLRRKALSRAANFYARSLLGLRTRDVTGGFRVYRVAAVRRLLATSGHCEGYGFQVEGVFTLAQSGGRITEVPITFREREVGVSKMNSAVAREAARRCLQLAVERWRTRPPAVTPLVPLADSSVHADAGKPAPGDAPSPVAEDEVAGAPTAAAVD